MSSILVLLSVTKFSDVIIWGEQVPFWMMLALKVGQQDKDDSTSEAQPSFRFQSFLQKKFRRHHSQKLQLGV